MRIPSQVKQLLRAWRWVVRILLRTPVERMASVLLAASVVAGFATLLEPGFSLRLRRGVRSLKVVPYFCGRPWFQSLADKMYRLGDIPAVFLLIKIAAVLAEWMFFPFVAFLAAVANPAIARSVIILVGVPSAILSASCRIRKLVAVPCANVLLTWVLTAAVACVTSLKSPSAMRWAVSDVSVPLYLAILGAVLVIASVQERLAENRAESNKARKVACNSLVVHTSLYLLAAVAAIWIITASDSIAAKFSMMKDAEMMVYRRGPFPWERCR